MSITIRFNGGYTLLPIVFLLIQINIIMELNKFYKEINKDKFKINKGSNLIEMSLFLSFLNIEVKRSESFIGQYNGWTQLENRDYMLFISGGNFKGVEYLDSLKYGTNLNNPYNNFVNPFYLFDIMNEKGKSFFLTYYKEDIKEIIMKKDNEIQKLSGKINNLKNNKNLFEKHFKELSL